MSLESIQQLYNDVQAVAAKTPGHFVEVASVRLFNSKLEQAKRETPGNDDAQAIPPLSEQPDDVYYSDFLAYVGQLLSAAVGKRLAAERVGDLSRQALIHSIQASPFHLRVVHRFSVITCAAHHLRPEAQFRRRRNHVWVQAYSVGK